MGVGNVGRVFIQYWLHSWNAACPSGWHGLGGTQCYFITYQISDSVPVQPITNIESSFSLQGVASSSGDALSFFDGVDTAYAASTPTSFLGLNQVWVGAEFNLFGQDRSSEACVNSGASLTVNMTVLNDTSPQTLPTCSNHGAGPTLETNNLNLTGPCSVSEGFRLPVASFTESSAQTCMPGVGTYWPVAFQANTHNLYVENYNTNGDVNITLGMMAGTVPSLVVEPSSNLGMAFQANTGHLWLAQTSASALSFVSKGDSGLAMKAGTSPSLAETTAGALEVAFQGSNGDLWLDVNGTGHDQLLGMAPGTSPSLVVLPDGEAVTAFQANTNALWIEQNGVGFAFSLGMKAGTSPSLVVDPTGGYDVAFQANNGNLHFVQVPSLPGSYTDWNMNLGMMAGTSPSLAIVGGTPTWAFQANTGNLYVGSLNGSTNQGLAMAHTASPTIRGFPDGWQVAYEGSNSDLWLDVNSHGIDAHLGMNTP